MATIPIEIIIQDAESPVTPTPESGEETNITVPDTGTISSSGDTNSSASSIILPAILLVLAIGSIVAILIHKHIKQKNTKNDAKTSKKEKLAMAATSTIAVLAATALVGNLVIPATKAATSDTTDGITPSEDKVSIIVTRDGGVAETSIESTATITSTSDFGYKVLLSMAEGVETSNLYLGGDTSSEYFIASTESIELTDNTWGYALTEGGGYSAIPLLDDAIVVAQGDGPVENEDLSIYYGVKVSSDLPAGTYSGGEVEYGLVAIEPTISDLTYMQDFAKLSESGKTSVLRSMTEDEQYTLKDSRDTKDYYISKLKDGNVWMTQNLDLDLDSTKIYTPLDTDISSDWQPVASTYTADEEWSDSSIAPRSYNPGNLYWSGILEDKTLSSSGNRHYHIGNFYNWTAAIAMNDSSTYTQDLQSVGQSICPAGWRMPSYSGEYTFQALINALGANFENAMTSPAYFVYGGDYLGRSIIEGDYIYIGKDAQYLTDSLNGSQNPGSPYRMFIYYDLSYGYIGYDSYIERSTGLSVRCVAR